MQFLADVQLVCEECRGKRYQKKLLEVTYKGKNIDQVLNLTVSEAGRFFAGHTPLLRKLRLLEQVGLGYLRLGQPATTLSGGEAQRIKLASYMARRTKGHPLFIFDEPTTGLHFDDIGKPHSALIGTLYVLDEPTVGLHPRDGLKLIHILRRLRDLGNTVVVVEHEREMISAADQIIDMGPGAWQWAAPSAA